MLNQQDIKLNYNDLYTQLRRYIWGFRVVEAIADLEISVYKTFADIVEVRRNYDYLYSLIRDVAEEDEDLQEACDQFKDLVDSEDSSYNKLYQVNEVVTDEDIEETEKPKGRRVKINTDK